MQKFEDIIGKDFLRTDPETCHSYAVDGMIPRAVLFPGQVEEVSEIVKIACREHLSVVPWGGGTQMGKGAVPSRLDLVIGTERLNRVIDIDAGNLTVTVQAGVRLFDLQEAVAGEENRCYIPVEAGGEESDESVCSLREHRGCFVPLDVPAGNRATIGGIIAANTSGPRRLLYGLPRDVVLGVRHVAPTGEIIGMGGKTVKNVAGYDLCKMMIGSLGTLGILCEMTLRLLPLPERSGTWICAFPGLQEAAAFVDAIFARPLVPCAVEILGGEACDDLALKWTGQGEKGCFSVAAAFEGAEEAVARMKAEIEGLASEAGSLEKMYLDDDEHRRFWSSYGSRAAGFSGDQDGMVTLKLNYPISRYRDVVAFLESGWVTDNAHLASYTHAGSGVTRIHLPGEDGTKENFEKIARWTGELLSQVCAVGGNLVVEHAGPELKKHLPVWGRPRDDMKMMQWIKKAMDPEGIFSPGRFIGGM
ncbi:MAG: FAD-binding oxidoreductase [Deltaproteobacteria bacterium]|nr:FAD-binding oxidoreductase [Deltaproteobacteria bacterium]